MENRKEDLARMIARNMASADSFGDVSEPIMGVTDFGEDADISFVPPGGVRTSARRPSGSSSSRSGSGAHRKKSSGQSGRTAAKKSHAESRKKKNKLSATRVMLIFTVIVVSSVMVMGGLYFAGLKTYENAFLDNTYISGVDVGGMDKQQALAELKKQSVVPEAIYITKKDGTGITIRPSDIGYVDRTAATLEKFYSEQDHGKWLSAKFFDRYEYTIMESFSYDKKKLENILAHKLTMDMTATPPKDAYITQNESGFFSVIPEEDGDAVEEVKLPNVYAYVESELDKMHFDISIGEVDCYRTAKIKASELAEDCSMLNGLARIQITFDFAVGKETLTGETVMGWIDFDENAPVRGLEVDRAAVESYVDGLSDKYDTFGKDREFNSTSRGTITVPQGKGCYGWWLDKDAMTEAIIYQVQNCESAKIAPIYYENPYSGYSYTCETKWYKKDKDWGDTYFDVDLEAQHMWYYERGKLKLESDIVSGYPSESRNTPEGVYKLWFKERGKTLTGSSDGRSYSSYVEYWNNISTISIGFHDASWQKGQFGGDRYKSSTWGSHGCINLPEDVAKYIYDNVELGTPVFAYW